MRLYRESRISVVKRRWFFINFPSFPVNIENLNLSFFTRTIKARILNLGILMDYELLQCQIEEQAHCPCQSLYLSIYLSFQGELLSQFSQEQCPLKSSNMAYIWGMSNCIVRFRLRFIALVLLILSIFLFSIFCMLTVKSLCQMFL